MATPEPKSCASCGRRIEWRRKWARDWEQVSWCSAGCRRRKVGERDRALEAAILSLLARRPGGATLCPSEAACVVADAEGRDGEGWRELMEPARAAARRLTAAGRVEITQRGHRVDPSTARGPIRIRARS